uniref:uncharacterized protein LOC122763902 n=1 Tax=Solea senegalensis TaxID=28829 RepID=UPI001CD8C4AD|nr:uncharacterized protein LOC122763902 [Solea senegalensis]
MTAEDDPEAYLDIFEGTAEACGWPEEERALRLLPLLTGVAQLAAHSLPAAARHDYTQLRRVILDRLGTHGRSEALAPAGDPPGAVHRWVTIVHSQLGPVPPPGQHRGSDRPRGGPSLSSPAEHEGGDQASDDPCQPSHSSPEEEVPSGIGSYTTPKHTHTHTHSRSMHRSGRLITLCRLSLRAQPTCLITWHPGGLLRRQGRCAGGVGSPATSERSARSWKWGKWFGLPGRRPPPPVRKGRTVYRPTPRTAGWGPFCPRRWRGSTAPYCTLAGS